MPLDDVRAFLLAGGRASRMGGRNKALVLVAGEPLVARTLSILAPRMPVTIVSDRPADWAGSRPRSPRRTANTTSSWPAISPT